MLQKTFIIRGVMAIWLAAILLPSAGYAESLGDLLGDLSSVAPKQSPASDEDPVRALADKYSGSWIEHHGEVAPAVPASAPVTAIDQSFSFDVGSGPAGESTSHRKGGGPTGQHIMPYGLHFCFFADASIPEEAMDAKIRAIVDKYAACGIAVQPHTFTLTSNYPRDPQLLGRAARRACDVKQRYGERGAVQVDVDSPRVPEQMCNEPGATGCSSLCETVSFSVVAPGSGPGVGLHESGHSNCCKRFCVDKGRGTQAVGNGLDVASADLFRLLGTTWAVKGNLPIENFSQAACESLRQGATKREEGYQDQRGQKKFYARAYGAMQIDITQGRGVLEREPKPDPDEEKFDPNNTVSQGLMDAYLASIAPHKIVPDPDFKPALSGASLATPAGGPLADGAKAGGGGPQQILYDEGGGKAAPVNGGGRGRAPASVSAADGGEGAVNSGGEVTAQNPGAGGGANASEHLMMDESAPKNPNRGRIASNSVDPSPEVAAPTGPAGKATSSGRKRKRGASFKRGHPITEQAGDLVSARPPGDFAADPVIEGGGGGGE